MSLPWAISFTCCLYSLGLPPELACASKSLNNQDLAFVYETYSSYQSKILKEGSDLTDFDGPLMSKLAAQVAGPRRL